MSKKNDRPVFDSVPLEGGYAMFTKKGNEAVAKIVREAIAWGRNEDEAYAEALRLLRSLGGKFGYEEAMDTAVREAVYVRLQEEYAS